MVLQLDITDLSAFMDMLNCHDAWYNSFKLTIDDSFCKVCEKYLLSEVNRFRIFRWYTVYRFFSQLAKCKIIAPVKVKLHPFRKGWAYMLDRGEVHLLSDLIFKSSHTEYIAVLLHESAHVVLAQTKFYNHLLDLDAQFAEKYFKGQHNEILKTVTPVEFFTQLITVRWFLELAKRNSYQMTKKALDNQCRKVFNKLDSAIDLLNNIQ